MSSNYFCGVSTPRNNNKILPEEAQICLPIKTNNAITDNKIMMNPALPERPLPQAVAISVAEHDRTESTGKKRLPWKLRRPRLRLHNVIDGLIFVVVVSLMLLIELGVVPHTRLGFICKDPTISYPFRGDTISGTTLLVGSFFGPICMIILIELTREKSFKRILVGTVWRYYKECLVGAALVLLITEILKVLVGEHRPHFFDSCVPDANLYCQPGTLILDYNCTNKRLSNFFKTDVCRSFPSGHTSLSLFVALYCSYLVQVRIPAFSVGKLTKPFLIAACLTWTCVCSLSRITDRRHHWWDVVGGAVLGVCGAWYTIILLHKKETEKSKQVKLVRTNTSTTTLLDVKNKDATSVII